MVICLSVSQRSNHANLCGLHPSLSTSSVWKGYDYRLTVHGTRPIVFVFFLLYYFLACIYLNAVIRSLDDPQLHLVWSFDRPCDIFFRRSNVHAENLVCVQELHRCSINERPSVWLSEIMVLLNQRDLNHGPSSNVETLILRYNLYYLRESPTLKNKIVWCGRIRFNLHVRHSGTNTGLDT